MEARKDICATCRFSEERDRKNGEHRMLECRRRPPTTFMFATPVGQAGVIGQGGVRGVQVGFKFPAAWPLLQLEHWCGEHEPVEKV